MEGRADFDGHETWDRVEGELGAGGPPPLVVLHGGPGRVARTACTSSGSWPARHD
jgi:hypothetical protein